MTDRASAEGLRGEDIKRAIAEATSLINPRLSEVEWDDVAEALDRTSAEGLREALRALRAENKELRSALAGAARDLAALRDTGPRPDSGIDVVTSYPSPGESAGFDALVEQLAAAIHAYGGLCRSTYGNRSCVSRDHRVMAEGIAAHLEVRLSTPETSEPLTPEEAGIHKACEVVGVCIGHPSK